MIIQRIINNNVISALDEQNQEVVVMGKGIGFQKKAGQKVDRDNIEKIFHMEDEQALRKFKELLADLPLEHVQVSNEIISYAKHYLGMELNQNVYITLTDHISFAITRLKEGMLFENALTNEICCFYPREYSVGVHALELIRQRTKVRLPEDEAASIAIHLVNAEYDLKVRDVSRITEILQQIMQMVQETYDWIEDDGLAKSKFVTDLKFLVHRLLFEKPKYRQDSVLEEFVKGRYPEEYHFVELLAQFLYKQFQCEMQEEEKISLVLDLIKVIKKR